MSEPNDPIGFYRSWRMGRSIVVEVVHGTWTDPSQWLTVAGARRSHSAAKPSPSDLRAMVGRHLDDGGLLLQPTIPHKSYPDLWTPVTVFVHSEKQ